MGKRGNQHQEASDIKVGEWIGTSQGDSGEVLQIERWGSGCGGCRVVVFRCEQTGRQMRCGIDSCYWVASPEQLAEFMLQKAIERNGQPDDYRRAGAGTRPRGREAVRVTKSRRPSNVGSI